MSQGNFWEKWERKLYQRKLLPLKPKSKIGIKRDVHILEVNTGAYVLANAFHQVMMDPNAMFGYIRVVRARNKIGKPYSVGERFQGRYDLAKATLDDLASSPFKFLTKPVRWLLSHFPFKNLFDWIDDTFTSDYGEIQEITLDPPRPGEPEVYQLRYAYLSGSPIAGSSTFTIIPIDEHHCRLTQVFLYQEVSKFYIKILSTDGIRYHNQVVYMQVQKPAELAGAQITFTTIPKEYQDL